MKRIFQIVLVTLVTAKGAICFADCSCEDWVKKSGYCVDYVKSRIPVFPVPKDVSEIKALSNKEIKDVDIGDVAIFHYRNFWHVAYVEKVHLDQKGNATAVDVSEMNFGPRIDFQQFKKKWGLTSQSEWKRAHCCGITNNYDQTAIREKIDLNAINQIWSSEFAGFQNFKLGS